MSVVNMKQLLEAGVHFGHQTKRWNPKMQEFIFTARNGIHIVDLRITAEKAENAYNRVKEIARNGGNVIFIGTKKQAQDIVEEEATRCGAYYVNQRWFGGTLTNFITIHKRILVLRELLEKEITGELDRLSVKERAQVKKTKDKLQKFLGGLKNMDSVPEAIFVTDTIKDHAAVLEARKLGITVIAIVDTNCNPEEVDIPIPGNDDAIRSIKFFTQLIANALIEGREGVDLEKEESKEDGDTEEHQTESETTEVTEVTEEIINESEYMEMSEEAESSEDSEKESE